MKAFTLIELIVVIAIIAILAAIIAPNAFRAIEKSKIARAAADLKNIKTAALTFRVDTGRWPDSAYIRTSSHNLLSNLANIPGWDGPYLERIAISPFGLRSGSGSCPSYGIYSISWEDGDCGPSPGCNVYWCFDLDQNGVFEVTQGVSVGVYGIESQDLTLKLDAVFDSPAVNDNSGTMNAMYPACGGTGGVYLFIGEPGEPHPAFPCS